MNLINFLDSNKIKWFPINVNEKKIPSYPKEYNSICDQNDFKKLTNEEIIYRQQYLSKCNAIAIDTSEVAMIDVDYKDHVDYSNEDGYKWIKSLETKTPWKKSNTKIQGKHLFIKPNIKPIKNRIQTKYKDIEILCGQWNFAPHTNTIKRNIRNDCSIIELNLMDIVDNQFDLQAKPVIKKTIKKKLLKKHDDNDSGNESPTPPSEFKQLGDLIDIEYLDDYDSWCKIIWSLANHSKHNFQLAKYLSMKSDKYNEESFNKLWNNTRSGNTIGTFLHYCKISNETQYYKIKSRKYFDFNDGILATLFIEEMPDSIAYKEVERQPIFMYNEDTGRWTNNIHIIKRKICEILDKSISEMRRYIEDSQRKIFNDTLNKIYCKSRLESIMSQITQKCTTLFDIDFDMNKYILPFKSKVLDLKTQEFRQYRKEDYITLFIDYDLEEKTDHGQKILNKLFKQIFPDECFRYDYLARLCAGLFGTTHEEFVLANGCGGNGKAVINELHHYLLTDSFCYRANNGVLLKSAKSGLNTAIANMDKKRTIIYAEPEEAEKIKISIMKELTGCQVMNAERKYSMNDRVDMFGTHILECNEKPKLDGRLDNSIVRRIRDIPFKSKFVDECDYYEDKYIFVGDLWFKSEEFKQEYKHQLLYYYIDFIKDYYKRHNKNLWEYMYTSEETKKESSKYIDDSDDILEWFNEICIKDPEDILILKTLYNNYKNTESFEHLSKEDKRKRNYKWFREYFKNHRVLNRFYKDRYQPVLNGQQKYYRNVLVGFTIKEKEYSNDLDIL